MIGNIHFASINDMAWVVQSDTRVKLISASSDGYCSFISFDIQENGLTILGERLNHQAVPEKLKGIYEAYEQVNFRKFEMEARENSKRNNQFKQVAFKTKTNITTSASTATTTTTATAVS